MKSFHSIIVIHIINVGEINIVEPLYLTKYIERMGTGTGDMIRRCREAGLREPEFSLSKLELGWAVSCLTSAPSVARRSAVSDSRASGRE